MKTFNKIYCILAGALISGAAQGGGVETLKAFVEGTKSARLEFAQTVQARSGRKPLQSAGSMVFQRPGRFRWEQTRPYAQIMVADGQKLWIYDPDLKQVTVRKQGEALPGSPAAVLAGDNRLEQNFTLAEGGEKEGVVWAEAVPRSRESGFEKLRFGFRGDELAAMELLDTFGQTTVLRFSRVERNPALPASAFRFTPPPGADVVGE